MAEVSSQPMRLDQHPDVQADRVSEWLHLLAAVRLLYESLEAVVSPFGLMLRDYELLRCLHDCTVSQAAIVRRLKTSKVSVSRGVRRLSAKGWVSVDVSNADKRFTSVALTNRGAEQFTEIEANVGRFLAALAAALDDEERRMLGQINEALRRFCRGRSTDAPCSRDTT